VRSIFGLGIDRGLVEGNPATGLRNRHAYRSREIIAGADHIRTLWVAIEGEQAPMVPTIGFIVRLALLTGLRRAELAATTRADLDLESTHPLLVIPSGRAKNRNLHRVPVSPQAAATQFARPIRASRPPTTNWKEGIRLAAACQWRFFSSLFDQ
jgi:integrase